MDELHRELKKYYGEDAEFREGQAEAIQGILQGKRTLVVQKTGWGKSLVYFLATKLLRKRSDSLTLIISPLLALMNNQMDSAKKLEMRVETINSENTEEWERIFGLLYHNDLDALIISPERLANDEFKSMLMNRLRTRIGLFVVDEAHCISDWGHDFRPDYRRIVDIIQMLPSNVPVLATTATANDRVVDDIKTQLSESLLISRGKLTRDSIAIQVIRLDTKEERLAWLAEHLHELPGTGVVYCLTVNDCKLVNKWLQANGINSQCFYDALDQEEKKLAIDNFMQNKVKVLVATVAFGMGFDKPDIGFVVHFQKPGNIVSYYQQIGRAGRGIERSYAILLCGKEDDEIHRFFIESAFPTEVQMNEVIQTVQEHPGLKMSEFEKYVNMKQSNLKKCIKYLQVNGDIYQEKKLYYKSAKEWKPDLEKSAAITEGRKNKLKQMNDFTHISGCYMKYIAEVLNDSTAQECHHCSNCLGKELIPSTVAREKIATAQKFLREDFNVIEPRKRWLATFRVDGAYKIDDAYLCEDGRVLSNYGDAGWGKMVSTGKYIDGYFDDQLVEASYQLLKDFVAERNIQWVTNISSRRRPLLVKDFAQRLAKRLGLDYADVILKITDAKCQKEWNTSFLQCQNAYNSFDVDGRLVKNENVLLVDDIVDSRWTFTVCGYKLRKKQCGKVYPFALSNSVGGSDS